MFVFNLNSLVLKENRSIKKNSESFNEKIENKNKNIIYSSKFYSNTFTESENNCKKLYRFNCLNCNRCIYKKNILFCDLDCETSFKFKN